MVGGEEGSIWELSVISVQFFCKPQEIKSTISKKKKKIQPFMLARPGKACIADGMMGGPQLLQRTIHHRLNPPG